MSEKATEPSAAFALKLAGRTLRRELRSKKLRTIVVLMQIALPAALVILGSALWSTAKIPEQQRWDLYNGSQVDVLFFEADAEYVRGVLPADAQLLERNRFGDTLRDVDGRRAYAEISDLDISDPLVADAFELLEGRLPQAAGELLLDPITAKDLGVKVGESIDLVRPAEQQLSVVGIARNRGSWDTTFATVAPGEKLGELRFTSVYVSFAERVIPDGLLQELEQSDTWVQLSPRFEPTIERGGTGNTEAAFSVTAVGVLALVVGAIMMISTFAARARSQIVVLGQLAGTGASPKTVFRYLVMQGFVFGVLGALMSLLLAFAGLLVLLPRVSSLVRADVQSWSPSLGMIVGIVVGVVALAVLASLGPAMSASKVSALEALAGRRPVRPVARAVLISGLVLAGIGVALLAYALFGMGQSNDKPNLAAIAIAIFLLGVGLCTPAYVSAVSPIATRLHGVSRYAVRSLLRERARTSGIVAITSVVVGLAFALSIVTVAFNAQTTAANNDLLSQSEVLLSGWGESDEGEALPDLGAGYQQLNDQIQQELGVVPLVIERAAFPDGGWWSWGEGVDLTKMNTRLQERLNMSNGNVVVATEPVVEYLGLSAAEQELLNQDGVLLLGAGPKAFNLAQFGIAADGDLVDRDAVERDAVERGEFVAQGTSGAMMPMYLPQLLVSTDFKMEHSLTTGPEAYLYLLGEPITRLERGAIEDIVVEHWDFQPEGPLVYYWADLPRQPGVSSLNVVLLAGLGVAALVTLLALAMGLTQSFVESRFEFSQLSMMGAPPSMVARVFTIKAVAVTLMGVLLALPMSLIPAVLVIKSSPAAPFLEVPWLIIGTAVVGLPVVAGAISWLVTSIKLRLSPVALSSLTDD